MQATFFVIVILMALAAALFSVLPLWRGHAVSGVARLLLAAAAGVFVLAVGIGGYLMLGSPQLAVRPAPDLRDPRNNDSSALIAILTQRVHQAPKDWQAWLWLGKLYMTQRDPQDGAAAFRRGIAVAPQSQQAIFNSAYGEALTLSSAGAVTPDAREAFEIALRDDPTDKAARYFLGLASSASGDNAKALAYWKSLLADVPADNPLHGELVDRIAALTARSGNAPDVSAMVALLADRLRSHPNDGEGWQRLVRAYAVLGDLAKAKSSYTEARKALATNPAALAALDAEAASLKLK